MRHVLVILLTLIAFIGLGLGVMIIAIGGSEHIGLLGVAFAWPLILVGTVALAGVTIATYIEASAERAERWSKEAIASTLRMEGQLKGLQMRAEAQLAETAKIGGR